MTEKLKMTVLIDNIAREPLACEWGLSILVEADERVILLDTGASGAFAANARRLGIDLGHVDTAVLSHAHYDHSDGMEAFFAENADAPLLIREGSRENCFGIKEGKLNYIGIRRGEMEKYRSRIRYVTGLYEIGSGIWLVPHRRADYSKIALRSDLYVVEDGRRRPDDFAHEQSLVIETGRGLAVFNSCSHTGLPNILADVKEFLGREDVYAYVGGLHLFKLEDDELEEQCGQIGASPVEHIYTGHCTGEHAFEYMKSRLPGRVSLLSSGLSAALA